MGPGRDTTILFAGLTGVEKHKAATAASREISRCLATLRDATDLSGGRVLKMFDAQMIALFPTPDAAASAAVRMHVYLDSLVTTSAKPTSAKPSVRIGFHSGPLGQRDEEIFGDTVNLALRLLEEASDGQIVTSDDTACRLHPAIENSMRPLRSIEVKGRTGQILVGELVWRQKGKAAQIGAHIRGANPVRAALYLSYGSTRIVRRRSGDSVIIGRDQDCDMSVADPAASRKHCTIERRHDKFVLRDHSTNGTFVTVQDEGEIRLLQQELTLEKRGWIGFGQAQGTTTEMVQYHCAYDAQHKNRTATR